MTRPSVPKVVSATAAALFAAGVQVGSSQTVGTLSTTSGDGGAASAAPAATPATTSATPAQAPASTWAFAAGLHPDTLEKLAARATAAVVLIEVGTSSGDRQGSGFVVAPNGRILTNYHVIRGAETVRVKLASGDVYDRVSILGTDERRDIAILQIAGFDLPVLTLGNSDSVRIGAPVVAIGSPMGLENTVSTGIVSGRRREAEGYQLLQISAPASTGSSGGPVLSRTGDVVGIAVSQKRGGQNLNFAVPINYARGLLDHLGADPVAVLLPTPPVEPDPEEMTRPVPPARVVNSGFALDLNGFAGYSVRMEGSAEDGSVRRSRVTLRRIETVGSDEARIERYAESETAQPAGSFGTPQTVRRARSRTIASANDLRPVSARGEIAWWTGEGWTRSEYDLRFEGYRVRGTIRDTTGRVLEVDRELPTGIILRELSDIAFGLVASDTLVGRSIELVTFDAATGGETSDRYDIQETVTVELAGRSWEALRVNVASDLSNTAALFRMGDPRLLLSFRRPDDDGDVTLMEAMEVDIFPPATPEDGSPSS